jgi:hypothetical protein
MMELLELSTPAEAKQMTGSLQDRLRWIRKLRGDGLDFLFTPTFWSTKRTVPVAYQAAQKDRISMPMEAECFATPPFLKEEEL